jgi:hypothetical protein
MVLPLLMEPLKSIINPVQLLVVVRALPKSGSAPMVL